MDESQGVMHSPLPSVRIWLCGPFEMAWVDPATGTTQPLDPTTTGRDRGPALSLLKLLLCQPERQAPRDWIMEQFWPEHSRSVATHRLENVYSRLRKLLTPPGGGESLLHSTRGNKSSGPSYGLDASPILWVDSAALTWHVEQAARLERFGDDSLPFWQRAFALLSRGPFLADEPYATWVTEQRAVLDGSMRQCVHALSRLYLARYGEAGKAEALLLLRTYWQQHQTDEDALRPLMELLGEQERYQEAEEYYQQLLLALADLGPDEAGQPRTPNARTQDIREYLCTKQIKREPDERTQKIATYLQTKPIQREPVDPVRTSFSIYPQSTINTEMFMMSPPILNPIISEMFGNETQTLFLSQTRWQQGKISKNEEVQMLLQNLLTDLATIATHMSQEQASFSRRHILIALAASPLTMLSSYSAAPLAEVFLQQCAASLVACNHLLKSQDFWHVKQILPHLIPSLVQVMQQSSTYQATIAHLITQCYLLLGILESHQLNWSGYQSLNERALQMSLLTQDKSLQVVAHVQLAMAFFHLKQPSQALSVYQEAAHLVTESSPLVQSNFFVKQAVAYGQAGRATEMQRCLEQAYTHFPKKPESDPSSPFTDFVASGLLSWKATAQLQLVQQQLETPVTLWETLSQADQLSPQSSSKVLVYVQNLRAETALALNDLELFAHFLTLGIQGAKRLQSARRLQEARDCYRMARKQWPNEVRVLELAELFIEEKKDW